MAANFQLSTASKNAACNAVVDSLDGGSAAGTIKVYDGSQPADANTAITTQTLLATFTLSATAFGSASSGVATLAGVPLSATAVATGTATWFRAASGGTGGAGTVFDGNVATSSADLTLNTTSITSGNTVQITSGTVTCPAH
jgi:hypothetical protein